MIPSPNARSLNPEAQILMSVRFTLWVGITFHTILGFVDPVLAPGNIQPVLLIRFAVIIPVLAICLLLTYSRWSKTLRSILTLTPALVSSAGFVGIMITAPENEILHISYCFGLFIVVSFGPTLLHLTMPQAALLAASTLLSYNFYAQNFMDLDSDEKHAALYIAINVLLACASGLGIYTRYITRLLIHENTQSAKIIARERNKIQKQMEVQGQIMHQLVDSKQKLDHSFQIRNKLLSLIAHDIKGPLASVKGIVEMFASGILTHDELQHHASRLSQLLNSTHNMLSNLLSWSVMHVEEELIKKETVDLNAIVLENFRLIRDIAESKSNTLINAVPERYYTKVDPSLLNLVVRNLISNAVKFTEKGKIIVSATNTGNSTVIDISDTGVGMKPEDMRKLFKWEERSSSVGTRAEKGSGIGLLISKEFVEKHGGELLVKSVKDQGTTFSVVLPQTEN